MHPGRPRGKLPACLTARAGTHFALRVLAPFVSPSRVGPKTPWIQAARVRMFCGRYPNRVKLGHSAMSVSMSDLAESRHDRATARTPRRRRASAEGRLSSTCSPTFGCRAALIRVVILTGICELRCFRDTHNNRIIRVGPVQRAPGSGGGGWEWGVPPPGG